MPQILAKGDMRVKFMAVSGSNDPWEEEQLGGKTLGVLYRLRQDEIYLILKPGFYTNKVKSSDQAREVMLLTSDQVDEIEQGSRVLTRRQALSMVMGTYDPLGLASPTLLHGKLLLRRLYAPHIKGGWDFDLPQEEKGRWAAWFRSLLVPVEAAFPRSTKPPGAVGLPRLVGFGDASMLALCVMLYVVWTDGDGRNHPRVLTGKCRVAPLVGTTIPRGELQVLVVLHQLAMTVVEAFPYRFCSISTYTDSLCSLGALHKPSSAMRPYFGNRVLEILRICQTLESYTDDLAPVAHIPGDENPADLGTRGLVSVGDLGPGSFWQQGQKFLQCSYDTWGARAAIEPSEIQLPPEECRSLFGIEVPDVQEEELNPFQRIIEEAGKETSLGNRLRSMGARALQLEKLEVTVCALARALQAVVSGSRQTCNLAPSVKMVEVAVRVLLRSAARSARGALRAGKLCGLGAEDRGGLIWVTGRIRSEQLATLLGTTALPVILPEEPLTKAILHKAHREDHRRGPRDAAARSRKLVWNVSATRLAKSVIGRCFACRYCDKKAKEQLMGMMPAERLNIVAPFEATALDLFGHFWVKDAAKGRRRFKCWVVCLVCMGTKAVCLLPCPGYGTEEFLTTFRFFTGLYGKPKLVYMDHAPSLIRASETPDWAEIGSRVGALGTEWRLTAKGCSWRNGLAERVIHAAWHSLGYELRLCETLDFHEFGSLLAVVSAIINSRPLSLRISTEGDYHSLAPRDILFGRAGRSVEATARAIDFTLDLDQDVALRAMDSCQAGIVRAWRARWLESVFPDMVARPKWRSAKRNLRPGDVGHVRYKKAVGQDDWLLAMVETANPDDDGIVRTVMVAFRPRHKRDTGKPHAAKEAKMMKIGVQRFAVLMAEEEMATLQQEDQMAPPSSEMM